MHGRNRVNFMTATIKLPFTNRFDVTLRSLFGNQSFAQVRERSNSKWILGRIQ